MDVVRGKRNKISAKKYFFMSLLLCFILVFYFLYSGEGKTIEQKELIISSVEQGKMHIQVEGYGKLRSSKQKLLTSLSNATVDEIILKPGALVTSDSIIMVLKNPELERELEIAKRAYNHELANLRKLELTHVQELLSNEEKLELIESEFKIENMRKIAMKGPAEKGIVSQLDFQTVELSIEQINKRISLAKKSVVKLKQVHAESINIQNEIIVDARSNMEAVQNRFNQLSVKAGMDGILQKLHVELGQSLIAGQQIALIGGTKDLVALIKVPQAEASQVQIGQKTTIAAGKMEIKSEVVRISPTVEGGSVEIEIALGSTDSTLLRPEQSVDAVIFIEDIDNVYFVQRPASVSAFSTSTLYKLSPEADTARPVSIEFGVTSGRYIQIKAGAVSGERLVISDLSYLNNVTSIRIIN